MAARKIKTDKLDILFSKLIRERASWCCEFCHNHYPPGNTRGLECAHIYGRARKGMRWHPLNAVSLCTGHHMYFTANPLEFFEWVEKHIGGENLIRLRHMAAESFKVSQPVLREIHENMKAEWARVQQLRKDGQAGRIEFEGPYPERLAA